MARTDTLIKDESTGETIWVTKTEGGNYIITDMRTNQSQYIGNPFGVTSSRSCTQDTTTEDTTTPTSGGGGWHLGLILQSTSDAAIYSGLDLVAKHMFNNPGFFEGLFHESKAQGAYNPPPTVGAAQTAFNAAGKAYFGLEDIAMGSSMAGKAIQRLVTTQPVRDFAQAELDFMVDRLNTSVNGMTIAEQLKLMYSDASTVSAYGISPVEAQKVVGSLDAYIEQKPVSIEIGGRRDSSMYALGAKVGSYMIGRIPGGEALPGAVTSAYAPM